MIGRLGWAIALLLAIAFAFGDVLPLGRGFALEGHANEKRLWWHITQDFQRGQLASGVLSDEIDVPLEQRILAQYTPVAVVFLLFDFDEAYDLYVLLHYTLLGLGAFLVAIAFGARPEEAFTSGVLASISGPVLSLDTELPTLTALAWLPWVLLALLAVLRRPSPQSTRAMGLLAIAFGFHLQGVSWVIIAIDVAAIIGVALGRYSANETTRPGAKLRAAFGFGLGAAISAIAIVPALIAALEAGASASIRQTFGITFLQLVELLGPSLFAPPDLPFAEVRALSEHQDLLSVWTPNDFKSMYLGSALSLLAMVGRDRRTKVVGLAVVAAFAITLSGGTFVFQRIKDVGPLAHGVDAGHLSIFGSALMAVFAPLALRRVKEQPLRLAFGAILLLVGIVGLVQTILSDEFRNYLALTFGSTAIPTRALSIAPHELPLDPTFGEAFDRLPEIAMGAMSARLVHGALFAVGFTLAAVAIARAPRLSVAPHLIAVLVALDLAVGARFTIFGAEHADARPTRAVLDALASPDKSSGRLFAWRPPTYGPEIHQRDGQSFAAAEVASRGQRGELAFDVPGLRRFVLSPGGLRPYTWTAKIVYIVSRTIDPALYPLLQRAGVSHVSTWFTGLRRPARLAFVLDVLGEAPELVYELPSPRPYVSTTSSWKNLDPKTTPARARLLFAADPASVFVVREGGSVPDAACAGTATVTPVEIRPGLVELEVDAPCRAMVVVQEPLTPRWRAYRDGHPVAISSVDLGWLAVEVGRGRGHLSFRYESTAPRVAPYSAMAFVLALGLLAIGAPRSVKATG
ncbi:MAG: hypothetical protein HY791_39640 [Deltaproteobacteria bacterium]|nr:hypothetical protein [Deltaproteobacteria bacterium]